MGEFPHDLLLRPSRHADRETAFESGTDTTEEELDLQEDLAAGDGDDLANASE